MGKYLHLYSTEQAFEADYNGAAYLEPWVSLTLDVDRVDYNKGPVPPPDPSTYPFTIEALGSGTVTFNINNPNILSATSFKKNDGEWTTFTTSNKNISVENGDEIQFKSTHKNYGFAEGASVFTSTAQFNVKGNIMSMGEGDNFEGAETITAVNLYQIFFKGQTNLISAENLVLPATGLSQNCYGEMFSGCTSLTTAPELPATTLTDKCYYMMFYGCTSLTTAPELPAQTMVTDCYKGMFEYCSSLNYVKCLATNPEQSSGSVAIFTDAWVLGVSSSGTFVRPASSASAWATVTAVGSGIPSGWTVQNA